jgi:hypothetical protein
MSGIGSRSSGVRFVASERKAIRCPSPEIQALNEPALPFGPLAPEARLTRLVVLLWRSRTKMSSVLSASSGARFSALERKTT